jgi:hypothetical protein
VANVSGSILIRCFFCRCKFLLFEILLPQNYQQGMFTFPCVVDTDCRSGECVAALDPWNAVKISKKPMVKLPWISCLCLDASENWLVCGNGGHCVTLWSLPGLDCVTRICMCATPQAVTIANDQILTVGTQPILSRWSFGGTLLSQAVCAPLSAFSVSVHPSGLTAVAGYGGLVDIISEFGSHLCTFCCG